MKKYFWRFLYLFVRKLPVSYSKWGGHFYRAIRYIVCSHIFEQCGKYVNIEKDARFGTGLHIRIGNHSGLGVNCDIPDGSIIGNDVMMGPNCYVHARNHHFDRTDIPMRLQGSTKSIPVIIEDDVWIGRNVTIMVGRHISKGTIIASNSVVTKDFPPYSIIGGNPAKLIRSRKQENEKY